MKQYKRTTMLAAAILFSAVGLAWAGTSADAATSCSTACRKFESCTVDYWKQRGKTIPAEHKRKLYPGCMKTCKKHPDKVQACYDTSKNSCSALWTCIQKHYKQ